MPIYNKIPMFFPQQIVCQYTLDGGVTWQTFNYDENGQYISGQIFSNRKFRIRISKPNYINSITYYNAYTHLWTTLLGGYSSFEYDTSDPNFNIIIWNYNADEGKQFNTDETINDDECLFVTNNTFNITLS